MQDKDNKYLDLYEENNAMHEDMLELQDQLEEAFGDDLSEAGFDDEGAKTKKKSKNVVKSLMKTISKSTKKKKDRKKEVEKQLTAEIQPKEVSVPQIEKIQISEKLDENPYIKVDQPAQITEPEPKPEVDQALREKKKDTKSVPKKKKDKEIEE